MVSSPMPPMPFSQVCGAFHGRTESLSDSVVAQPEIIAASESSAMKSSRCATRKFISGSRVRRGDFVAFKNLAQFPARNDVGDAAVFLNIADDHLGDQLAFAADEHFAGRNDSLIVTNVEHHEIPLGIHDQNLALQIRRQQDVSVRSNE